MLGDVDRIHLYEGVTTIEAKQFDIRNTTLSCTCEMWTY